MKTAIAFTIAFAFAIAAPWGLAYVLDAIAPGLGAVSLVFTLVGAPYLAINALFSDFAIDNL